MLQILDIVDGTGSGDVDTAHTVEAEESVIAGLHGNKMLVDPAWENPTGAALPTRASARQLASLLGWLCWGMLGCWGGYVGVCWAMLGCCGGYVGVCWAMLGCWSGYVGVCWAMLGCWGGYVGLCWAVGVAMLGCWGIPIDSCIQL